MDINAEKIRVIKCIHSPHKTQIENESPWQTHSDRVAIWTVLSYLGLLGLDNGLKLNTKLEDSVRHEQLLIWVHDSALITSVKTDMKATIQTDKLITASIVWSCAYLLPEKVHVTGFFSLKIESHGD